ncbi:xanthine dehydrogenase accessory factor [Polynucleobacter meluiroseus]|uniref:Xanthine dehydrogenase accessory factor n=1 Tax=Polynucleobacter meluiroseus TaxID=1938814 RepID=A0A240DZL3_9BURK|nr:XdhC family protein [Polynucleobacter meluiroseus]SNX28625.1 xanthine dehydrogenase accessory factor [Polynucleobacter meluiroseus]
MNSADLSVLKTAVSWLKTGHRVAIATVVQTWGSAPRPVGSWLAIREDGQVAGSVSGGCVEDDLIRRVQSEILSKAIPEMVVYGVSQQEAARFGLPCGGTLRLLVEPHPERAILEELLHAITHHETTSRIVNLGTGKSRIERNDADLFYCDDEIMRTFYGPRWRMVIIGAGQLSIYTAEFALAADFEVIVIDPREEYAEGINLEQVQFFKAMPDDVLLDIKVDAHTAVVALTHDPKLDDMALMEALKSPAFYVGALGSRVNTIKRKERLLEFDVTPEQVERLHGPVGLNIGALTPPEIAISILAEVIAVKYGASVPKKG